ncbi:hypothetical protein [Halomonas sp. HL-93]|uniref:hypothetical protein n=1 Tax=Halomonas sp. HL-93 TaxID=1666906 RepID=UPI0007F109D7|nr:hypothetical protein [Halomonas sp. HL-93]SBR45146.1 hypothetical protein GA0071314_0094 [Halomonas sp. HL-93]
MNTEYKKIIENGFSILPKSGRDGSDKLYLLKNNILVDYVEFKNNRRISTVEDFKNTRVNTHRDLAMYKLNNNIRDGLYN